VANTVSKGTRIIDNARPQQTADHVQTRRIVDGDAARQSKRDRHLRGVLHRQQHAAVFYERDEIVDAVPAESRPNVVGFVDAHVRRELRLLPWHRITPHRQAGEYRLRAAAAGRKQNYIVFRVEVRILRRILGADVRVGYVQEIERLSPPTFGLSAL